MADRGRARPLGDRLIDVIGDEDRAHRDVARGEPLGHGHQVGDDPVVLAGEERPGAAEGGDHLVGDEKDVELGERSRIAFIQPAGGTSTPPEPWIGSA